jgi:hypothetical protein
MREDCVSDGTLGLDVVNYVGRRVELRSSSEGDQQGQHVLEYCSVKLKFASFLGFPPSHNAPSYQLR